MIGDSYYCEPCRSFHPDPTSRAHWKALKCFRPWSEWSPSMIPNFRLAHNVERFAELVEQAPTSPEAADTIRLVLLSIAEEYEPARLVKVGRALVAMLRREITGAG